MGLEANGDVLDGDSLLPLTLVAVQSLQQRGVRFLIALPPG
jgi:hypothetical protein